MIHNQSNRLTGLHFVLFLSIGLLWGLIGCQQNSRDGSIAATTSPTTENIATSRPTFTPLPSSTNEVIALSASTPSTNLSLEDILQGWPLVTGNVWVYTRTNYGENEAGVMLTESYLITETITSTTLDTISNYYVAEILQETRWLTGDTPPHSQVETEIFWYIIAGNAIYKQQESLNLSNVLSSWLQLLYSFPESSCWFPGPEREQNPPPEACNAATSGPITWETPTESIDSCYNIVYGYNSGAVWHTFCPGIGFVSEFYNHAGTHFGYRTELIAYFNGSTGSNGVRQEAE